ncbi:hypothetical protein D9756_002178 [Leucocoprinus leucothites]|uniref:RBR-type E3 ubiquitin transferase n=1 Tax=Leucocoprinus leucothites TaxID=201217 RepID=A0A8H5GCG5_9AGAR|nr:hypothetical protein D9756_002178 [Leucoagaricus leucothites]
MASSASGEKSRAKCRLFQGGNCRYGTKCRFLHEAGQSLTPENRNDNISASTQATPSESTSASADTQATRGKGENVIRAVKRVDKPCHAFKAGNCQWGDKCNFKHDISVLNTPSASSSTSNAPLASTGKNARRRKGKGKNSALPTPNGVATSQTSVEEDLRGQLQAEATRKIQQETASLAQERVAAARRELQLERERQEAARLAQERVVAARQELQLERERQEAARLAQERVAAARRELQLQLERERAEAARLAQERAAAARRQLQLQLEREREEAKERERAARRRKQEEEWAQESSMTIQQVVLNSFVKFGAGLTIQHVISGFEASRILVKNLPMNAKPTEVLELFTQQGIAEEDLVILSTDIIGGFQQATILGKAADVDTVAIGLDGIEFRDQCLEFVVCERSSQGRTMGASNRNSYHLTISWRPAFLTMLARYPHLEVWDISQKAHELDRELLNGQRVRAAIHWEPQGTTHDEYNSAYPTGQYAVKITKISSATTVQMVKNFAGTQRVEIYQDPTSYTSNDVFTALNSHLRGLANTTLRTFNLENVLRPNSVSAKAIFSTYESAKSAHDSLTGKVFGPNFPSLRVFLSDPHRFLITLDEKQYDAQETQWMELCEGKVKEATIQIKPINKGGERKVIVSLVGRDKKVVGALKVRIESMASGQRLDVAHWHPTFKSRKGQEFLGGLYDTTGAYVRSDWRHNCVVVFGGPETAEDARSRIKKEVERISSEQWTIPLQRKALGFFIREGLAQMQALLGEENVTLDVGSAKIVLHGADLEEARHHLRQLMDAFLDHNLESKTAPDDILCPICYDTVSQPIEISCNHIYCSSCLRHYILSTLDNHSFPLKCMGDDATCNHPFSLPLIKRFLPPQRFEQLMTAAFTSHIDKNPETFRYCITPDCSQVYRVTVLPHELQCPSCFYEICTACHVEGHAGMTCAEKCQHKNPEEQERLLEAWANQNNVKRCPSCRVWVEKIEGCHHISCKCGTHFCWICSGVFEGNRIYDHMTEAHGDWYNDPDRNRRQAAAGGQPREQVPNIVEIAGGRAAVAEQAAELRRLELQRENRAAQRIHPAVNHPLGAAHRQLFRAAQAPALPPRPAVVVNPHQEQLRRFRELQRQREAEEENERRARLRQAEERQRQLREARIQELERAAIRRRENEARQREAEKNKGWCIIM